MKRINKYTGQLLVGPNALWPTQPKFSVGHPAYPIAPTWVLGDAVSLISQRGPGRSPEPPTAFAFCCIECFQNASGRSIFGSLVSIAMSGEMKANSGSGRIWYLLATYKHHP